MVTLVLATAVPQARADDDDTAYLAAVQSVGVPANSPASTAGYGRGLCTRISDTGFDPLVTAVHQDNAASGVTMHQSALIIGAAVSNYCLEKVPKLPKKLDY
jgi:hypothetical protein